MCAHYQHFRQVDRTSYTKKFTLLKQIRKNRVSSKYNECFIIHNSYIINTYIQHSMGKVKWNKYCFVCHDGGDVMCCEGCHRVAHAICLHLKSIPENDWYCKYCAHYQTVEYNIPKEIKQKQQARKLKVLELFKGTGSITKYCSRYPDVFEKVVSVDNVPAFKPTHLCDIREWNYGIYKPNYFDIIFASPPCTEFSRLKTTGIRDLELGKELVIITQEIIHYFQPRTWFIENPATGLLPEQDYMKDIPFYDVDYCKYSDFGYRKRTRIFTNLTDFKPLRCQKDCGYMDGNKHINTFGGTKTISLEQKYRIPDMLLHKLFWHCLKENEKIDSLLAPFLKTHNKICV